MSAQTEVTLQTAAQCRRLLVGLASGDVDDVYDRRGVVDTIDRLLHAGVIDTDAVLAHLDLALKDAARIESDDE